jgi:hypothetical protein
MPLPLPRNPEIPDGVRKPSRGFPFVKNFPPLSISYPRKNMSLSKRKGRTGNSGKNPLTHYMRAYNITLGTIDSYLWEQKYPNKIEGSDKFKVVNLAAAPAPGENQNIDRYLSGPPLSGGRLFIFISYDYS